MPQSEILSLLDRVKRTDPYTCTEQAECAAELRSLCDNLTCADSAPTRSLLEAAAQLLTTLAGPDDTFEREDVKSIATLLLTTAARAAECDPSPSGGNDAQELPPLDQPPSQPPLRTEEAEAALRAMPPHPDSTALGPVLLALGYVIRTEVADALQMSRSMGLPLGECLLLSGATSPARLLEALRIQQRMRSENVDAQAASQQEVSATAEDPAVAGDAKMPLTSDLFLGEILLGANMIAGEHLEKAMHIHFHERVRIGEALVRIGALTPAKLAYGLEIQRRMRNLAASPAG